MFCYSNDLNMCSNVDKKQKIQNIQSNSIHLENILARKYYCISIKIMAEKRKQALSLSEFDELAKAVLEYPCLYDKAKKEYKDKTTTENARK